MSRKDLNTDFSSVKHFVQSFFDEDLNALSPVVPKEEQLRETTLLKETLGSERFFFVIDIPDFEIKEAHGINRWLGYSDSQFSLQYYWENVVHPECRKPLLMMAQTLFAALCKGVYPLQFMVQRYSGKIALKHRNGHYVYAKKTSSIFQYDDQNRLLGYLNEFTILGDYNGEPIEPRMYNSSGERETEKEQAMLAKNMERFLEMKIFSAQELQIARKLAYEPEITQQEIADQFNLSRHTVDTYYKRFLVKARDFFHKEFRSATETAVYLRREGLL
jgi:hypothetical protein